MGQLDRYQVKRGKDGITFILLDGVEMPSLTMTNIEQKVGDRGLTRITMTVLTKLNEIKS